MSGQSSSSKTVAAILKQHQDLVAANAREIAVSQHSLPQAHQQNRKKSKQKAVHNKQAHIINHLNAAKNVNFSSSLTPVSQTMNRSLITSLQQQEDFGIGKESKPAPATKASSLSRDLSPSRITAQMQKVMPDQSTAHQNLLLSALQGNMPETMGIFNSTKPDTIMVSTISDVQNFMMQPSKSPMESPLTTTVFSNSLAPVTVFSCPDDLDIKEKSPPSLSPNLPTVENLLALSAGSIQTINVSHRGTIPSTTASRGAKSDTDSSSIMSTRHAMEVAQQIRMEANGQSTSAMCLGTHQQLRTQIKGSRSIDAQLASKQNPAPVAKPQPTQKVTSHEKDQKSLEVSMPLLAAKLAPSSVPGSTGGSPASSLQLKQSPSSNEVPNLLASGATSVVVPSALKNARKSPVRSGQFEETKKQLQQNRPSQHENSLSLGQGERSQGANVESALAAVSAATGQIWTLGHDNQRSGVSQINPSGFDLQIKSGNVRKSKNFDKNPRPLPPPSLERTSHSDQISNQTQPQTDYLSHKLNWNTTLPIRGMNFEPRKRPTDKKIKCEKDDFHILGVSQAALPSLSKYVAGESKQTAIDVDLDVPVGQLSSIVAEDIVQVSRNVTGVGKKVYANFSNTTLKDSLSSNKFQLPNQMPIVTASVKSGSVASTGFNSTPSTISISKCLANSSAATINSFLNNSSMSKSNNIMSSAASLSSSNSGMTSGQSMISHQPPLYESPPPPYPHQTQNLSAVHHHKQNSYAPSKDSNQNPFTFPTSGLTLVSDSTKHGFTTYSVSMANTPNCSIAGQLPGYSRNRKSSSTVLNKSHSDISAMNHNFKQHNPPLSDAIPRLVPEGNIKLENEFIHINHVQESKLNHEPTAIQPFNQRISNLSCYPVMNTTYRAAYRSHAVAVQRAKAQVILSTAKSLDVLRQNLQSRINKEICEIIKRYSDKFFEPALHNIQVNNNEGSLGSEHINYVCRQILEEAKSEYISISDRRSATPSDIPDNMSDSGSTSGRRTFLKRSRISDSDSERGSDGGFKRKATKRKGRPPVHSSGRVTPSKTHKSGEPIKREGPRWDPSRIKPESLFVMGARANKALGLGNTRGKLYIRHPDVFKYIGDQEDKLWLYEHNLMPATGGKAYMLLLEDIEELSRNDDYRDSPGLMMHECVGFTVPEWMIVKMKEQMNDLRTDKKGSGYNFINTESEDKSQKILPFSSFTDLTIKDEVQFSPADTEEIEFMSTVDNDDDTQQSCAVSPFTVTGGFDDRVSPSPSDLDPIEETSAHHLFS